jgi:hypothetical protein
MKNKTNISAHESPALGSDFKLSAMRPSKNSLRFGVQSERMKKEINISARLSQILGLDFKLSAMRPSKNSLRFGVQLERTKKEINILAHLNQALGSHLNKQFEVWNSIPKNKVKD